MRSGVRTNDTDRQIALVWARGRSARTPTIQYGRTPPRARLAVTPGNCPRLFLNALKGSAAAPSDSRRPRSEQRCAFSRPTPARSQLPAPQAGRDPRSQVLTLLRPQGPQGPQRSLW